MGCSVFTLSFQMTGTNPKYQIDEERRNVTHAQKEGQSAETNLQMTQALRLADKNIKAAITTKLKHKKANTFMINREIGNLSIDIKTVKTYFEVLELKNTILNNKSLYLTGD